MTQRSSEGQASDGVGSALPQGTSSMTFPAVPTNATVVGTRHSGRWPFSPHPSVSGNQGLTIQSQPQTPANPSSSTILSAGYASPFLQAGQYPNLTLLPSTSQPAHAMHIDQPLSSLFYNPQPLANQAITQQLSASASAPVRSASLQQSTTSWPASLATPPVTYPTSVQEQLIPSPPANALLRYASQQSDMLSDFSQSQLDMGTSNMMTASGTGTSASSGTTMADVASMHAILLGHAGQVSADFTSVSNTAGACDSATDILQKQHQHQRVLPPALQMDAGRSRRRSAPLPLARRQADLSTVGALPDVLLGLGRAAAAPMPPRMAPAAASAGSGLICDEFSAPSAPSGFSTADADTRLCHAELLQLVQGLKLDPVDRIEHESGDPFYCCDEVGNIVQFWSVRGQLFMSTWKAENTQTRLQAQAQAQAAAGPSSGVWSVTQTPGALTPLAATPAHAPASSLMLPSGSSVTAAPAVAPAAPVRLALGTSSLYVRNLPPETTDWSLQQMFQGFGSLISCKIAKTADGTCKGFGFVNYHDRRSAVLAVQHMNGWQGPDGRRLAVVIQEPRLYPPSLLHPATVSGPQ